MKYTFREDMDLEEMYGPIGEIETKEEALAFQREWVAWRMETDNISPERATAILKTNIGYYGGYFDEKKRGEIEELFDTEHPFFGRLSVKGSPTPQEALKVGFAIAKALKKKEGESKQK